MSHGGVKNAYNVRRIRAKRHLLDLATVASLVVLMGAVSVKRAEEEASGLDICAIRERAEHTVLWGILSVKYRRDTKGLLVF